MTVHTPCDQPTRLPAAQLAAELAAEQLNEGEQMSLIDTNVAAPINAAVALNEASDGSVAYANAEQTAPIYQTG